MKKYLILLFYIPSIIYSQEYDNKIIPFPFGNPNFKDIRYFNGNYVIPVVYPSDSSTLIVTDMSTQNYYHYVDFVFSLSAITVVDNEMYLYAKDRNLFKGLQLAKLNEDYSYNWKKEILTEGISNFPTSSISIGQNIFGSYIYEEDDVSKFGIFNTKPDGSVKWNKTYEDNIRNSIIWDLYPTKTSDIYASYAMLYKGQPKSIARVMKIDTTGQEKWKSDILTDIYNVNTPVWMTELSDSNIFLTFKKDKFLDPEFFNFHPYPPAYIWLDKDGKKIRENILKVDRDHEIEILELKAGKGDYFYIYGQLTAFNESTSNDYYGFITKYANNGDTIWTHTYRHPNYNDYDHQHYVKDLIEEDNGGLTVLGAIDLPNGKREVWVFRVNSEGCFGTDSCEQFTLADRDISLPERSGLRCYPNPTTGRVTLEGLTAPGTYAIRIYSIGGRLMESYITPDPSEIDLGHLERGIYIVNVTGGKVNTTIKVIRQ